VTDHPITPPPELVQQWDEEGAGMFPPAYQTHLTTRAAQWGADQELEACCEWLDYNCPSVGAHHLRNDRRPKPPSDKEQACKLLECYGTSGVKLTADQCNTILRALKTIPDDWGVKLTADQCNTILRALEAIPDD
jgi:hypothetical protein